MERGNLDIEKNAQREDDVKTDREKESCNWSAASAGPRIPRIAATYQKQKEARKNSLLKPAEKARSC